MSSLTGGAPAQTTADQLVDGFRAGLHAGRYQQRRNLGCDMAWSAC